MTEAKELDIILFGGTGTGTLRYRDDHNLDGKGALILAQLDGYYDGGDGGNIDYDDELLRGE